MEVAPCHIEDAAPGSSRKKAEGWDLATFRCDVGCPKSVHRLARDVVRQYGVVNVRDRECGRWSRLSTMASTPPIVEASDAEAD